MTDKNIQIIGAAIKLFAQDGLSVTTAQVSKEAKVSHGTLFNYFTTKQDLIDGVYFFIKEKMANNIMRQIDIDSEMKNMFFDLWMSYIYWANKHPLEHQVIDILKTSQMLSEDAKKAGEHLFITIYEILQKGIDDKVIIDVPVLYLCEVAGAHLNATVSYTSNNNLSGKNLENHIRTSFNMYWNGIKA